MIVVLTGLACLALAGDCIGQPPESKPTLVVSEQADGHGWEVEVSFAGKPQTFGRVAHAWTLDYAKEVAEQFHYSNSHHLGNLAVASFRIRGKDGDGSVRPGEGLRFPDWPLVEHQFRANSAAASPTIDQVLRDVETAYRKAAVATAQLFSQPQPTPTAPQQAEIEQLYRGYNKSVTDLSRVMNGATPPLPRLRPLRQQQWHEHAVDWSAVQHTQFAAEKLGQTVRRAKADNDDLRKFYRSVIGNTIRSNQLQGTPSSKAQIDSSMKGVAADMSRWRQAFEKLQKDADFATQSTLALQNALTGKLVDSSSVLPNPSGFTSGDSKVFFVGKAPNTQVYKTDAVGRLLPDDKQPDGYPRPLDGSPLGPDERTIVEPALRYQFMSLADGMGTVTANIYGKVVDVDAAGRSVAIQVDEAGNTLEYDGVDPQGIKVGQFVTPRSVLGTWGKTPGTANLYLRGWSRTNQPVEPGDLLKFGAVPPVGSSLRRPVKLMGPTPLPVKPAPAAAPDGGKAQFRQKLAMDENAPKFASLNCLDNLRIANALLAKAKEDLRKEKASAEKLANKLKSTEEKLQKHQNRMDPKARSAAEQANRWNDRSDALEAEREALRREKTRLDAEAAQLAGSKNNAAIADYNRRAQLHNAKEALFRTKEQTLATARNQLDKMLDSLTPAQARAVKRDTDLTKDRNRLTSDLEAANGGVRGLQDQVDRQQSAVNGMNCGIT
jgi:hypothetical protein